MSETTEPTTIAAKGDLILEVGQDEASRKFSYRVDSELLKQNSRYFDNLLSLRFNEGQQLLAALEALQAAGHSSFADVPVDALPSITIVNVGRISKVSSIQSLVADFLRALHNQDLSVANPPVANLANLAVVADRFDALQHFSRYIQRRKYLVALDARTKARGSASIPEEKARQKLLVGLLFDHSPWVTRYSKQLILRDSVLWKPGAVGDSTAALWWDVPNGIEDELIKRRECILDTINSLQSHFLKLYTSGERQCKLGYDSSPQCDSFQLGEAIRFFTRLGTLRLQGTIYDNTEPSYYNGDISRLLESLRQSPSYQIDRNHAHCGLRSRFIPLLDLLQNYLFLEASSLEIGICNDCWKKHRDVYPWSSAKGPMLWSPVKSCDEFTGMPRGCLARHLIIRDIFMAVERNWTA
ncbi:hypothetical protein BDV96DRAFT_610110 [Lophiotrema nucula]|uniref:BTB domain-containing protein n=1 Tax=Lophiotrema nucula TaxID=690887 RepID=A0A6A5ZP13_9PLEO|nr:hypothetical protein BDV96DRAFT_610110 [Lophiotrema nucula]